MITSHTSEPWPHPTRYGRTWFWPLATLIDRNPRPGYGFQSEHLPFHKASDMFIPAGLVSTCCPLESVLAETWHSPIPWCDLGDRQQQSQKTCRNNQTVLFLSLTHCQPEFSYGWRSQPLLPEYAHLHCLSFVLTVLGNTPALHVYVFASSPGDHCPE